MTFPNWMLGIAVILGAMSYGQVGRWASESSLWSKAALVTPQVPRPIVNLAHLAMDRGDDREGERLLNIAGMMHRPISEQVWTLDLVNANLALIRMRQHRFAEAKILVNGAPYESARWQVCHAVKAICDS